jgi:hypothetical protein
MRPRRLRLLLVMICLASASGTAAAQPALAPYSEDPATAPMGMPLEPDSSLACGRPPYECVKPPPPDPGCGGAPYDCRTPKPIAYQVEEPRSLGRPRYGLIIAGAAILGGSYLASTSVALRSEEWRLAIPLAGPFFEAHHVGSSDGLLVAGLIFDGLVQTTGAVLIIVGAASRHKVRRYDRASVSFAPSAGVHGAGLAAVGRF